METLDYPSWRWGLSLIALTMAIHAAAVVMMGIVAVKIRVRLETRVFDLWNLIPIMICIVGVMGLLLAVVAVNRVRDLGSGVFMAWRSRLAHRRLALFHRLNEHARRFRAHVATTLAVDGRSGVSQRDAGVWC
jgi:hypothetical protein